MAQRWRLGEVHRVLDVGCGVGHWSQRLARFLPADARIVGVDRETGFRDKALARAKAYDLAGRFKFRTGSANALPFDDGSFDLVTCQTVLIHVSDAATVLREMVRVCRRGGLVIAAEPNNLVNALQYICGYPRLPWSDIERYLRFTHVCREGKLALGDGDTVVGERLPGLFADAGLGALRVHVNDQCPWLLPPYDRPRQRAELDQLFQFFDANIALIGGPEDESRRRFLAGGGSETDFQESWALVMRLQREFKFTVEAGNVSAARGFLHYLVSGRKHR
jgi:SAM-dependent methyltransferase